MFALSNCKINEKKNRFIKSMILIESKIRKSKTRFVICNLTNSICSNRNEIFVLEKRMLDQALQFVAKLTIHSGVKRKHSNCENG